MVRNDAQRVTARLKLDWAYEIYGEDPVELPDGRDSYLLIASAALTRRKRG